LTKKQIIYWFLL